MKITKSQLKELIRHAIVDLNEKDFGSKAQYDAYRKKHTLKPGSKHRVDGKTVTVRDTKKMSKKAKSLGDKMADKLNKRMADLEKKRKQGKIKEGASSKTIAKFKKVIDRESTMDVEDMIMNYDYDKKYSREIGGLLDDMRDEEQGIKPSGYAKSSKKKLLKVLKKAINESKKRRFTVKEVRMWMKKLEENRYKKVYNSDARRVAWMVNNEGRTLDEMPMSMKKKWSKAQYGRERYLAKEFLKSKLEQMNESWDSDVKDFGKKSGVKVKPHSGTLGAYGAKPVKPEISKKVVPFFKSKGYKLIKKHQVSSGAYKGDWVFVLQGKDKKKYMVSVNTNREGTNINFNLHEGKLTEAISGADRKILFILVREIVRNLKSKIKNMDVNNKSHLNRVGSSILAIIRAMTYSPDNVNYKNFKKYFPKNFNSKLIQKKLKQFHSQNDKVQVTLVTQAIKNELGAGVKEGKLSEQKFKKVILPNDMKTKVKVSKMIKQLKLKIDKDYDVKALKARGGDQVISILPKHYNKFIELAMKNKLNPRG